MLWALAGARCEGGKKQAVYSQLESWKFSFLFCLWRCRDLALKGGLEGSREDPSFFLVLSSCTSPGFWRQLSDFQGKCQGLKLELSPIEIGDTALSSGGGSTKCCCVLWCEKTKISIPKSPICLLLLQPHWSLWPLYLLINAYRDIMYRQAFTVMWSKSGERSQMQALEGWVESSLVPGKHSHPSDT